MSISGKSNRGWKAEGLDKQSHSTHLLVLTKNMGVDAAR